MKLLLALAKLFHPKPISKIARLYGWLKGYDHYYPSPTMHIEKAVRPDWWKKITSSVDIVDLVSDATPNLRVPEPESMLTLWAWRTVTGCLTAITLVIAYVLVERVARYVGSCILHAVAERYSLSPTLMRSTFSELPVTRKKPIDNHTHGTSAMLRSTASSFATSLASRLGISAYYVQQSLPDQRKGRNGSRSWYWSKDLLARPEGFWPGNRSLVTMIDVDYYVDMPDFLTTSFLPTLLYTFTPQTVAKSDGDYSFTFEKDAKLKYSVSGGAVYKHFIWNYNHDTVKITNYWGFIPTKTCCYHVDRKRVDDHHSLILLTPTCMWIGIYSLLAEIMLSGPKIERFDPVVGDYLRMYVQTKDGMKVSTGEVGHYSATTVSAPYDEALEATGRFSTSKLTLAAAMQYVKGETLSDKRAEAAPLYKFHQNTIETKAMAFPVQDSVRRYEYVNLEEHDPEAPDTMAPFMTPLIHGAFVPVSSEGNDKACIKHRLTDVKPKDLVMTPFIEQVMHEFVNLLFPDDPDLLPVDLSEVGERQNRPAQRAILERASHEGVIPLFKSFQKKESYVKVSPPRNITTIDGNVKLRYSAYIYALADYYKECDHMHWYAFSHDPEFVTQLVCAMLGEAETAVPSDFSKFDGTISGLLREFEKMVLAKAFHPTVRDELMELHSDQYNKTGLTRFRVKYDSGTSRGSGSPETSALNTTDNAFVAYLTFRSMKVNGEFMDPATAWEKLGLYGGDDGLTADIDVNDYISSAKRLGLKLTAEEIKRGERGVCFLSRYYTSEVWNGNPTSCCDIARQLSKFHVTTKIQGVSPVEKLLEKSRAYYLMDKNTPIIGEFASKVVEIHGCLPGVSKHKLLVKWGSDYKEDSQYPNEYHAEFDDLLNEQLNGCNVDGFRSWLSNVKTLEDCLTPPLLREPDKPVTKHEAVVDGDVALPDLVPGRTQEEKQTNDEKHTDTGPIGRPNQNQDGQLGPDGNGSSGRSWNSAGGHTPDDSSSSSADTVPISNISRPAIGSGGATRKRTRNRTRGRKQQVQASQQRSSTQV